MLGLDLNKVMREKISFFIYTNSLLLIVVHLSLEIDLTKKVYSTWHFSTKCDALFTAIHNIFYKDKKKIVPSNIGDLIGPAGLA